MNHITIREAFLPLIVTNYNIMYHYTNLTSQVASVPISGILFSSWRHAEVSGASQEDDGGECIQPALALTSELFEAQLRHFSMDDR